MTVLPIAIANRNLFYVAAYCLEAMTEIGRQSTAGQSAHPSSSIYLNVLGASWTTVQGWGSVGILGNL
jgi:hypothetical protein